MPVTSPDPAAASQRAVFLSYASEDAAAAERIAKALRTAGIEVWFDKSELRGGDAWDQSIRRQIRDCTLFIPVVSANSQGRPEGYFRLEWDLADQRTHLMGRKRAFIVPICMDATSEREADVPDSFLAVQWTRLPGGEMSPAFVERIKLLLSGEASANGRSTGSAVALGASPRGLSRWRLGILYASVVLALILLAGYLGRERLKSSAAPGAGPLAASIAVLPLANESGDSSQQYFSDGISEDLITALSQFQGLKVIGRTSAFQFRDSKENSHSIGAKLGVAHLLEGSVRRSGDLVRVRAELIDTTDGSTQWSERYDRPYKDLFALQDEITRAVAAALRAKLLPGEDAAAQSGRPPNGNLEAYNALLQGQFHGRRFTEADFRKAIEFYNQATQLDPHYAYACSALSIAWTAFGIQFLEGEAAQEAHTKARAASDRALADAPGLAIAHTARGYLLQNFDFDWRGAEAEFRRAVELAPNDAAPKFSLAALLATLGQAKSAIELTQQAIAADPLRSNWYSSLASYLSGLNRLDEAEEAILRAIELQPAAAGYHWQLAVIEIQRGNAQAALAAAQQEPDGQYQRIALAFARQIGGDRSAADAALKTLIEKDAGTASYQIADVYALRNDPKAAFDWLDRAWSNRDSGIGYLLYDPLMLRYKDDPSFSTFCRKVGLPTPAEVGRRT